MTKDVSFFAVVHCNIGIFLRNGGSLRRRNFPLSRWFTATKEFSFVTVVHRNKGTFFHRSGSPWHDRPERSHTYDVQTFGYTPLKEVYQTCTLGCIDTPRSHALRLDHYLYLGPFEFIFVAVVHLNEGTFFCHSGSPWHEVPTILKQENYFSEKKGVVPQIVGKKKPWKVCVTKKKSWPQKNSFMYLIKITLDNLLSIQIKICIA